MARMLAVIMTVFLVLGAFISPLAEAKLIISYPRKYSPPIIPANPNKRGGREEEGKNVIKYPAIGRGNGIPKQKTPPIPANPYRRGCEPSEHCRGGPKQKGDESYYQGN
ncbi:hypothetical protein ABFS82_08G118200 [Erythranthe guttata]|uniref:Uncharacterized protein n=1 Tax=Erythranthe guttata TaxID=4155 RepID=A0A022RW11_ERYGU|nr:hypothetical protein MIMGU_mgv1a016749mg [Erythranthe guttata]